MSAQKRDREEPNEDEEYSEEDTKPTKKAAAPSSAKKAKTSDVPPSGDAVFSIGSKRKVTVSVFKGKVLVNIREFYDDRITGEEKPGNKGIALTKEQFESLKSQIAEIDQAVQERST